MMIFPIDEKTVIQIEEDTTVKFTKAFVETTKVQQNQRSRMRINISCGDCWCSCQIFFAVFFVFGFLALITVVIACGRGSCSRNGFVHHYPPPSN